MIEVEYRLPLAFVSFFLLRGFGRLSVIIPPVTKSSILVSTLTLRGIWVLGPSDFRVRRAFKIL